MNRQQFSVRFNAALDLTISYTKQLCYNNLSPAYKFIVSPNESAASVVLDDIEKEHVKTLKDIQLRPLLFDEVLDLIQVGDKHPLWINISVYESLEEVTLIEMVCSKRLRKVEDMPNNVDKFPPFHVWVPTPAERKQRKVNNKFDVNWRKNMAEVNKKKGLMSRIKSYFAKN